MTVTTEAMGSARVIRWDNQRHRNANAWQRLSFAGSPRCFAGRDRDCEAE